MFCGLQTGEGMDGMGQTSRNEGPPDWRQDFISKEELGIPVKYIGIGEKIDDLQKFDADQFVNALFDVKE